MYRISQLAEQVGLSRSTLLYYEKLGLIKGVKLDNGYRSYTDRDLQQLRLLQQLHAAGLTLKQCQACLSGKVDRDMLLDRLHILDKDIAEKQQARELLSSMLGLKSMRKWHETVEQLAPSAHLDWLQQQGFSEKSALRLKWISKDMNQHEQYMTDFEAIFENLDRLGPGDESDFCKALAAISYHSGEALEIGCGKGVSTELLAKHSDFTILATDNDEYNLSCVKQKLGKDNIAHRVNTACCSMLNLPFTQGQFDLLWSEGSAYIMGVELALKKWRPFLKSGGYLVISDLVWFTDKPAAEAASFWQANYPDMTNAQQRVTQMTQQGYRLVSSFPLSQQAWANYLAPLTQRVEKLKQQDMKSNALNDIARELQIHEQYLGQYGYQMFVLKKQDKR
ncbi:MerR family transcriptional regulator [Shewanella waksmanii]|uniref:MerR family transcriptional regulator n=1 Tax=Shewanella waksmanii TaxID=213783 RepID=UPI003735CDCB